MTKLGGPNSAYPIGDKFQLVYDTNETASSRGGFFVRMITFFSPFKVVAKR